MNLKHSIKQKSNHRAALSSLLMASILMLSSNMLHATAIYGGVVFPEGDISFADAVVDYSPQSNDFGYPHDNYRNPNAALGTPEGSASFCSEKATCPYVTLGMGGSITLQFIDNLLTGSDDDSFDLWIFEVGGDVEDTFVEISSNGDDWFDVGKVTGSTSGIDLDAFGFGASDIFSFVRLTDDPNEGEGSLGGITTGADIDAVGAISTIIAPDLVPTDVDEPSSFILSATTLLLLARIRRKRRLDIRIPS